MGDLPKRRVIRDAHFERDLRALIPAARDADEFVEAAEFVLARDPLVGIETAYPPLWALSLPPLNAGQLVLYYEFDDSTVLLVSIVIVA